MPKSRTDTRSAALWLGPSAIGVLIFFLLPLGIATVLATQSWDLLNPPAWVGADNLASLADPRFLNAVGVTVSLGTGVLAIQVIVGFGLAQLLSSRLPGHGAMSVLLLLPWMMAPLATGIIARWIFAPSDGVVAMLAGVRFGALDSTTFAPLVVILVVGWQGTGLAALIYLGALHAIPADLRAAAALDGLSHWQLALRIDWPLVRPTTAFVTIGGVVQAFALYDLVVPLTGGGPDYATETVAMRIVFTAWQSFEFGSAAVLALAITVIEAAAIAGVVGWMTWRSR